MGAESIRAGKAYVELGVQDTLRKGLDVAAGRLKAFGDHITAIGNKFASLGKSILSPLQNAGNMFATLGSGLALAANRTNLTVESLSSLAYAAQASGVDLEGLEGGLRKLSKNLNAAAGGSKEAQKGFEDIGLSVADLVGMKPEDRFKAVADAMQNFNGDKAAAAMAIFGKTGTTLLPMLANGAAGIEDFQKHAEALGLVMSGEDASAALTLQRAFIDLWDVGKRLAVVVGTAVGPALKQIAYTLTNVIVKANQFIQTHGDLIVTVAKVAVGVVAAGAALYVIGSAFGVVGAVVGGVASVIGLFAGVLSTVGMILSTVVFSGVGLVLGGLVALGVYFAVAQAAGGNFAAGVVGALSTVAEGADHLLGSWSGFTQSMISIWHQVKFQLMSAWVTLEGWLSSSWEYLKGAFPEVIYGWGGAIGEFAVKAWEVMKNLGSMLMNLWGRVVDFIADKLAESMIKAQAQSDVFNKFNGKTVTKQMAREMAATEYRPEFNRTVARERAGLTKEQPGLKGQAFEEELSKRVATATKPMIDAKNKEYEGKFSGRKLTDDELNAEMERETAARQSDREQLAKRARDARQKSYDDALVAQHEDAKSQLGAVSEWSKKGLAMTPLDHMREAEAAKERQAKRVADLAAERDKTTAADKAALAATPTLSGFFNDLIAKAKALVTGPAGEWRPPELPPPHEMQQGLQQASKIVGTFNSSVLSGLGGGGAAEKTATNTGKIVDLIKEQNRRGTSPNATLNWG